MTATDQPIQADHRSEDDKKLARLRRQYIERGWLKPTKTLSEPYAFTQAWKQKLIKLGLLIPQPPQELSYEKPDGDHPRIYPRGEARPSALPSPLAHPVPLPRNRS